MIATGSRKIAVNTIPVIPAYTDIGHSPNSTLYGYTKGKFSEHRVWGGEGHDEEGITDPDDKGLITGRIDHDKKMISVTHGWPSAKRTASFVARKLGARYPQHRVFIYPGTDSPEPPREV